MSNDVFLTWIVLLWPPIAAVAAYRGEKSGLIFDGIVLMYAGFAGAMYLPAFGMVACAVLFAAGSILIGMATLIRAIERSTEAIKTSIREELDSALDEMGQR